MTFSSVVSAPLLRRALPVILWVGLCLVAGCGGPPQVLLDDDCQVAVEALWTAVNSRDVALLDRAADELDRLHTSERLPENGHAALNRFIEQARRQEWDRASADLRRFISGQRKPQNRQ